MMSECKDWLRLYRASNLGAHERGEVLELKDDDGFIPEILSWSLERIVFEILPDDKVLHGAAAYFLQHFLPAYEDLKLCQSVNRMMGLPQFGIKTDLVRNAYTNRNVPFQASSIPSVHTRWNHCKFVAAVMIAFGVRFKLDFDLIALGAISALLHDVGHPAFGHDLDDILVSLGRQDHEARSQTIVLYNSEIRESLDLLEIDSEDVVKVISEEGGLGRLQNIADTLGYVVLDSQVTLNVDPIPIGFIWEVIESVDGVRGDQYLVNNTVPIEKLINYRADMFRDVYSNGSARIAAHVLRNFYRALIEYELFVPEEFERDSDGWIKMVLPHRLQVRQSDRDLPGWFRSAMNLAFGFTDELQKWNQFAYNNQLAVELARDGLTLEQLTSRVVIPPSDYRKKTYVVIDPDGVEHKLQAPESHIPETHKRWYVLYHRT